MPQGEFVGSYRKLVFYVLAQKGVRSNLIKSAHPIHFLDFIITLFDPIKRLA